MPTKESQIIQVTSLKQLKETLSELEKGLFTHLPKYENIKFNGKAWVGVWDTNRSDIGNMTTYFEGDILLRVSNWHHHAGENPCAYDYSISCNNNEYPSAEFRYYLEYQLGEKQPPWQNDKTYKALTLRERMDKGEKDIFPEVKSILLFVE